MGRMAWADSTEGGGKEVSGYWALRAGKPQRPMVRSEGRSIGFKRGKGKRRT